MDSGRTGPDGGTCAPRRSASAVILRTTRLAVALLLAAGLPATPVMAAEPVPAVPASQSASAQADAADVAWMLIASALVLMMTAPGLAMFYGGLVRKKNVLSVIMQCVFLMGMMSVLWAVIGYSLAFGGRGGFIGNVDHVLLRGLFPTSEGAAFPLREGLAIPELLFMAFQGMFFVITPALICGAFAERIRFAALVPFIALWGLLVYCPIAHWVWQFDGWLAAGEYWSLDFAGGTVVHVSGGVSALVCALLIRPRLAYLQEPMPPHNLTFTAFGTALLWVGWFGFNAGSAGAANSVAVNAFVATHLAAAAGLLAWSAAEWIALGRPTILGACSGAVAGLVGVTPAAGFVNPVWGMAIGAVAGVVCYFACTKVKNAFRYDDSLDAFGIHGVGGTVGAVLTGVVATKAVNAAGANGLLDGGIDQFRNQLLGVAAIAAYSALGTLILFKFVDLTIGARVRKDEELRGLDLTQHGEEGYIFY